MTERYKPTGTPLTPYEAELLVLLMEECSEIIQAAAKLIRFGRESFPDYGENSEVLSLEVGDAQTILDKCLAVKLIDIPHMLEGQQRKEVRLRKFMQNDPPKE